MTCPFEAPGRQEACLSLMRQREEAMKRTYDENECYSCPQRRKRMEAAKPPQRINIPVVAPRTDARRRLGEKPAQNIPRIIPAAPEPTPKKEETSVADEKAMERVLSRILREKSCARGRLMNYCAVGKALLEEITAELEKQGKIKAWPKGRSTIFTLPDGADPWEGQKPPVSRKAAGVKSAMKKAALVAPLHGLSGPFASTISDLMAKKDSLMEQAAACDRAITALRGVA